jgi:hypothetical protein
MCAKLTRGWYSILCVTLGIGSAGASTPLGLREALAEFETGATRSTPCAGDRFVGSHKEISRFQILPSVWQQYSTSRNFRDPQTAWTVAAKILRDREQDFRRATQRDWNYVDIYLLWNAPGQYQRANWDRRKVSRVVRERAQRFANLMEDRTRVYAGQYIARN